MKKFCAGVLLFLCAVAAGAQTTTITASHINYFGGAAVTGQFCVTPTDQSGNPINLVTPSGQQLSPLTPLCFPIVNGVLSTTVVPDTSQTQPANACLKLTLFNNLNIQVGSYPCIQPQGSTWSFDAYIPNGTIAIPAYAAPQFQLNGSAVANQTLLNFICPTCTYASGALTLPTGGTPNIANNTILGNNTGSTAAAAPLTVSAVQALLFPSPGAIGGTTPAPGTFSTLVDTALGTSTSPVCPNGTSGALTTTGCVTGSSSSNENLSFSATPTFSTSYTNSRIVLSGNITSFTLAAGTDGQTKCLNFAHDATSTAYTVAAPSNVRGLMSVGATASKNNLQCFKYFTSDTAWLANDPGVVNE